MDDCRHHSYTGVSNQRILKNIAALSKAGKEIIVRIPIIPGVNDDVDNLTATTNFLLNHTNVRRIDILPYHHIATPKYARLGMAYSLADLVSPSDEAMNDIVKLLMQQNFSVKIGG